MNYKQQVLTKQQLFVNPITILQKQKSKLPQLNQINQSFNNNHLTNQQQTQNFNQLLLSTIDQDNKKDSTHLNKTKHIKKTQIPVLSSSYKDDKHKHYRTRMCPQGLQCRKRLVCQFAHNQYQLRRPYKNRKNPCMRYQKGLCSLGAACPDYHGNMDLKKKNYHYKTQKCKDWWQGGSCSKGKLCIYIHNEQNDNEASNQFQQNIELELQENEERNQSVQNNVKQEVQIIIQADNNQNEQQIKKADIQIKIKNKIGDIFNNKNDNKKPVLIKEVIEQKIQINKQKQEQNINEQQNFNIQFNF